MRGLLSRRDWMRLTTCGGVGVSLSGWMQALAEDAAPEKAGGGATSKMRGKSCILLWMSGGPSQTDTLDPKPGHANGGPFKSIDTVAPGIQIAEHLPQLAKVMDNVALIRSMSTKEGDHSRATYLLRTGYLPQGPLHYPTLGALLGKELGQDSAELPNFVSVSPYRFLSPAAFGPGFLGPQYAPLVVGGNGFSPRATADYEQELQVRNVTVPKTVTVEQADARLGLLDSLENDFATRFPGSAPVSHRAAYSQAVRMMRSAAMQAFELSQEPDVLRDAYGRNQFGQACLLARRLVEQGVPFIEVSLNGAPGSPGLGWDTHAGNFEAVKALCHVLDPGWATLIRDLKQRGLLDTTLVVWMGEFGRTPNINSSMGRDHFPTAWSTALAGGGLRGGQIIGRTNASGMQVDDRPVTVPDLLATICRRLGIDPLKQNMSDLGRPIGIVDRAAKAIVELL